MSYGVTSSGFVKKTLAQIQSETEQDYFEQFGEEFVLDPRQPAGQEKAILDERISLLWDLAQAVYSFLNVEQSEGASLENLVALNGISRLPATKSKLTVTVSGGVGLTVPAGMEVQKIDNADIVFVNPTEEIIDGSGQIDLVFEGKESGPDIYVEASNIELVVPVAGITGVDNAEAAIAGTNIETDAELKARRKISIQNENSPSDQGIRAALLAEVENVTSAQVISNRTDSTVDGRPPHSFEAILEGGLDGDIAQVIYNNMPAGIKPYGDESVIITDTEGYDHEIGFSYVSDTAMDCQLTIGKNTDTNIGTLYPDDGDLQVKNALVDYFATFNPNQDVINTQAAAIVNSIPGITSLTVEFKKQSGGSYTEDNITITAKEQASLAFGDISIV